jgi:hypothetical protein
VAKATYALPRSYFTKDPWALEPPAVAALLTKIKARGVSLRTVIPRLPVNGIKTGLNQAFLIDADEQARLVAQDSGMCIADQALFEGAGYPPLALGRQAAIHDSLEVQFRLHLAVVWQGRTCSRETF